ncbi:MAG TPA: hypothetical protein VEK08_20490 [Planctomycetota bacterium]|nr:hypothetical protein [Planctomycetota bacterium]
MDEVVRLIVQKTGISEEQARSAAETVVSFIKSKLPPQVSSQIDNAVSGSDDRGLAAAASGLGGLFGGKG